MRAGKDTAYFFSIRQLPSSREIASQLKTYIEQLRGSGVTDFSEYLNKNPQEAANCMSMIKTVAFNDAFLRLMEADNPDQLMVGLYPTTQTSFFGWLMK